MLILRLPAVKQAFGHRSNASVYNAIRAGLCTTGVAIGQRAKGWPDYEVNALVAARISGKTEHEIRDLVNRLHAKRADLLVSI